MNILPVNKNTQAVIAVVTDYYIYVYIYFKEYFTISWAPIFTTLHAG